MSRMNCRQAQQATSVQQPIISNTVGTTVTPAEHTREPLSVAALSQQNAPLPRRASVKSHTSAKSVEERHIAKPKQDDVVSI